MESPDQEGTPPEQGDETSDLGYRNVEEEEAYDEAGSQGDDPGEPTERDDET
jgi:hypothetical protein